MSTKKSAAELKAEYERALARAEQLKQKMKRATAAEEAKKKAEGYANSLYFGQDDPEKTPPAQHELYLAKKELDEYPLSQQYQKAYYAVRRLYAELDEILFGPYQYHLSCGGKPHA